MFKVVVDPFVGKLGVFRVHQGTVTKDTQLFIGDGRKPFKVGHLFLLQGGKSVEIDRAVPGDIAAVAKVDEIEFDCVLHDSHDEDHIHMRPLEFPVPMHGVAITPKKRGDEQRISDVLHRMIAEDPTIVVEHDADRPTRRCCARWATCTCARSSSGCPRSSSSRSTRGRRGFRIARRSRRMPRASTGTRSRPAAPASSARCRCASSRSQRGAGFEFVEQTKGGVIPHQFMPAVQKGVEQVLATGAVAGFPLQDVRVVVHDGKHHPVDSKEVAFVAAGKKAFLDAIEKARPIVLEPIVSVEIICPEGNTGDIAGDLSSRRGQVTGTTGLQPGIIAINGLAPLVELEGYSARLKSVTGGHGSWSMQLSHYEQAPPNLQQQLATEFRKSRKQEEDESRRAGGRRARIRAPSETLARPAPVDERDERRGEEQRPQEPVRPEERELPGEGERGDEDRVADARCSPIRNRHRIGDHEEGEQQESAVRELVREDAPRLAEPRRRARRRVPSQRPRKTHAMSAAPRALRHEAAQRDEPAGECNVVAPLSRRHPGSRQQRRARPITPRFAGLNTCLPFARSTNFDEIASAAASGWTHSVSARSSSETPKAGDERGQRALVLEPERAEP